MLQYTEGRQNISLLPGGNTKNRVKYSSFSTKRDKNNLSLVVWGSNLTSSVGIGRHTKQVRDMIKLPSYKMSVIVGLLLSDG